MKLASSASALGLYKYGADCPTGALFGRFYALFLSELETLGLAPTFIGAEGNGYSEKLTRFGGKTHAKLLKTQFDSISILSIVVNPSSSQEPAYDKFASATLSYVESLNELLVCIVINEAYIEIGSIQFDNLLRANVDICLWDFGFGFSYPVDKQPDYYILGIDNGELTREESKALNAWYDAPGAKRTTLLRDVFPYTLLNRTQLDQQMKDGVTLRQFAQAQPGCSLTPLPDSGLCLWRVPKSELVRLREVL